MHRPNDQIGAYRLLEKIGRGMFGEVWLAEEKTAISTHRVALKLPNEEGIDIESIRREAGVWETVKGHPNILPIIKADIIDDQIYIASEYAPDGPLSKWLRAQHGKSLPIQTSVNLIRGILSGLEHLHSKGVIHRDLKPENILLQADTPRIADFGIARLVKATSNSTQVTGTPAYMAPECFYAIRSVHSDIWAVGIIFHLLLSGRLPFPQPDQVSVMNAILNQQPQIDVAIPMSFRKIIEKALQKEPNRRYQSASAMWTDIRRYDSDLLEPDGERILDLSNIGYLDLESEQETAVNVKFAPKQRFSSFIGRPIWVTGIALSFLVVLAYAYFTAQSRADANPESGVSKPTTGGITEAQPNNGSPEILSANSTGLRNHTNPTSLGDVSNTEGYDPWKNDAVPTLPSLPPYVPQSGQVLPIDPQNERQSMQDANCVLQPSGILLCTVPVTPTPAPKTTPTPRGTPVANANTATAPATTPTPPRATPTPRPTAAPARTPAANRPDPNGLEG